MNKTLKKAISIILTILMIVTGVPFAFAADGHTHALSADGENIEFTEFTADITEISTEANYYLTQDIELTKVLNINVEGTVNLCLNGHSITTTAKTSNNTVIMLFSGTLNLCDCQGSGCITTASKDFSNQGIFGVNASEINMYSGEIKGFSFRGLTAPTVNMYGGKITGCDRGVYATRYFNMYGGEISGCNAALSLESDTNEFTMHGGKIINNEATDSAYAPVNIVKGVFTMNGGEVSGNQNSGYGAVYVRAEGSFIMNGGKISDNVGDGVYNCGNTTINAGEISGNTDAGVYFENASTLTLKGGKITNNGSGIKSFYFVTAYLAGDGVQVTGNKDEDVSNHVSFEVSEQLTPEKTQIGISGYGSGDVFARPDGTNITTLEGMEACFYGTDDVFQVVECEGGELYLTLSNPYIYENENGDYVVETPFDEGVTFEWYENGRFLKGETSAVLSKDKIKPGNKYTCLVLVDGVLKAEFEEECPSRITHQPTAGEPYVELNDAADASYQWYIVEEKTTEVTDENASAVSYDWGESSYSEETGWTGVHCDEEHYGQDFFTVELKAGETLAVEVAGDFTDCVGLYDYDSYNDVWKDAQEGITTYEITVDGDGNYTFYTYVNSGAVTVKAYKIAVEKTAIDGETSAKLKNPEFGKKYACEVIYADGKNEKTDIFEYTYAITHQPTADERYVELNNDTGASYQWYTVEGGAEITDENASGDWQSMEAPFDNTVYEDGKWIADDSMGMQYYFMVDLEAGDTVNLEFASEVEIIVFAINGDFSDYIEVGGTECSVTVEESGTYWLVLGTPVDYVRATVGDVKYTPIDGQTTDTLTTTALGKYACEATFVDGTTEMSESFEVTSLHDCDFSGEWKYDADKHWKECTADGCDKISEEAGHTYTDGKCDCGYACPHSSYTMGICDVCNYLCPHSYTEFNEILAPKCEETGLEESYCDHCNLRLVQEIPATDHKWTSNNIVRPTQNTDGTWTDGYYYDKCENDEAHNVITGVAKRADYSAYDEAYKTLKSAQGSEALTDEGAAAVNQAVMSGMMMPQNLVEGESSTAYLNNWVKNAQSILDKIANGEYVKINGIEEIVKINNALNEEITEKYGEEAVAELADKLSDEVSAKFEKIYEKAEALTGTVAENKEALEEIKAELEELFDEIEKCLAGTHSYGEGVLTRPTFETAGYYTYTCSVCGHSYTEPAKRADSTALNDASMKVTEYIDNDTLTQEAKDEIYKSYRDILMNNGSIFDELGFVRGDLIEEDQPIIDEVTAELEKIIADADEKIESGEYVKADYTEIDEAIAKIEQKLTDENITDEGKAGLEEIKAQLEEMKADENTSEADLPELEKALEDYEEELDKGIEDGTLVEVDVDAIADDVNKKWAEKLEAEGLLDEYEDFINNQKATDEAMATVDEINDFANSLEGTVAENAENIAKLNEMLDSLLESWENCLRGTHNFKDYEITSHAKCEINAKETGTCWFCGETDEREIEGTALSHSFTKYEVTEEAECGKAGKEISYCDHGCGATDEKEIAALEHIFLDYTSNGDATCTSDGTKTASCLNGCGATDTVADEGSKLDHADEDGDKLCDDCQTEIIDTCPQCGRPVHEGQINEYICLLISIIRFVLLFIKVFI